MNKEGKWVLFLSIAIVIVLVVGMFLFFALYKPNNQKLYENEIASGRLKNPTDNKSYDEALQNFDQSYVYYLLYSIGAYNLRNVPLTSNNPKIEISLNDNSFNADIENGIIKVFPGTIDNEDVIIKTTREEIVSMLKNESYVPESFKKGRSSIGLKADKATLFAKGYLNMYNSLTNKGITGSVIGIYTG